MELRQLRQFIALAEAGSFRMAAERLFMAQPPLSVAIKKLEEDVGTPLFERTAKGVRLTPAGEVALIEARRCLRSADQLRQVAHAAEAGDVGELHVAFISSVTFGLLPRLIQAFRAKYPGVRLVLHESNNRDAFEAMRKGVMDLSFVRVPAVPPAGIAMQVVEEDSFCVAMSVDHPLATRTKLALRDLSDEPFIAYQPSQAGGGLHAGTLALFREAGFAPRITQEAMQVHTVIGLVEGGLGIALVPSVHAEYISRRVAFIPLQRIRTTVPIGVGLGYREDDEVPASRRFREVVSEVTGLAPQAWLR
jgi:DNA-binding transcriptional LysR family regulator